jgi:tripartite-type tricarboxylate transporter receptor subunit TctC
MDNIFKQYLSRRIWIKKVAPLGGIATLGSILPCPTELFAQTQFPTRPLKLIVPFAVGGSGDLIARLVAEHLSRNLGQTVLIENKGGNGSTVGTEIASKASPDGYTLVLSNGAAITVGPLLGEQLGYKPMDDFVHISLLGTFTNALIVRADHPAQNFSEFLSLVKSHPGRVSYASAGVGSAGYLTGELLKSTAKIDMVHIPYKGTGPAMSDLLGGQIEAMFNALIAASPFIKSGKVRALAITANSRSPDHPEIPTMAETIPGVVGDAWFGISAPSKTPQLIVERLSEGISQVMQSNELRSKLIEMGLNPTVLNPKEFNQFLLNENKKWGPVIKFAGLKANS